jgi:hypothetical protein
MPIEFNDLDVVSKVAGLSSALIVPCNMCPAVSVAVRENKPFIQFFKSFLKSAPFEQYIKAMQSRLGEKGVQTKVFKSNLYHQWFLCMWTAVPLCLDKHRWTSLSYSARRSGGSQHECICQVRTHA